MRILELLIQSAFATIPGSALSAFRVFGSQKRLRSEARPLKSIPVLLVPVKRVPLGAVEGTGDRNADP